MPTTSQVTAPFDVQIDRLNAQIAALKQQRLDAVKVAFGLKENVTQVRALRDLNVHVKRGDILIFRSLETLSFEKPWIKAVKAGGKQVHHLYGDWEIAQ